MSLPHPKLASHNTKQNKMSNYPSFRSSLSILLSSLASKILISKARSLTLMLATTAALSSCILQPKPEPTPVEVEPAEVETPPKTTAVPAIEQAPYESEIAITALNEAFNCTPAKQRPAMGLQSKTLHLEDNAQISSYRHIEFKPLKLTYRGNRQANTLSKKDYLALQVLVRETLLEEWRLRFAWNEAKTIDDETLSLQIWLSDLTSNTAPNQSDPVRLSATLSRANDKQVLLYSCTDALYLSSGLDGAHKGRLQGSPFWQKLSLEIRRWGSELGSKISASE